MSTGKNESLGSCAQPGCDCPVPPSLSGKRGPRPRYCEKHRAPTQRQARYLAKKQQAALLYVPIPIGEECGSYDDPEPGSAEWCELHGIDPEVWRERGVWRYSIGDQERVKAAFRQHLPSKRLGVVSNIVRQSPGQVMPKHALPAEPPIPPQLRPDSPVITDPRVTWHYHGPEPERGDWPSYPPEAGPKLAGKPLIAVDELSLHMTEKVGEIVDDGETLPIRILKKGAPKLGYVMSKAQAEGHIERKKRPQYDPATGRGDHRGDNLDFVHSHAPHEAKYTLLGERGANKRIDVHPRVLSMLKRAKRVIFVMEGALKTDACVSAGEATLGIPSVGMWNPAEVAKAAEWVGAISGKNLPFVVLPDADGIFNDNVTRQALLIRSCLRRARVPAYIAAPFAERDQEECKCGPRSYGYASYAHNDPRQPPSGVPILNPPADLFVRAVCIDCGGYWKAVDDWRGVGGSIEELVISGPEAPVDRIKAEIIERMRVPAGRKPAAMRARAARALEGLSLHAKLQTQHETEDDELPVGALYLPLATLAKIMDTYPKAVVQTLEDLGDAIEVHGSLETEVTPWPQMDEETGEIFIRRVRDWKERPVLVVPLDFRSTEPEPMLVGDITGWASNWNVATGYRATKVHLTHHFSAMGGA